MIELQEFDIHLKTLRSGFDSSCGHCWVAPTAGIIPGKPARAKALMHKLDIMGDDVFSEYFEMHSDGTGNEWTVPVSLKDDLGCRDEEPNIKAALSGLAIKWHPKTKRLLGVGQVTRYVGNALMPEPRPRNIAYTVYDEASEKWQPWKIVTLPDKKEFFSIGTGMAQRYDLDDGRILLPAYAKKSSGDWYQNFFSTVLLCRFDGDNLIYESQGNLLTVNEARGLYEPSITSFGEHFYLTLRNDTSGYVARSRDGLIFNDLKPWRYDDGSILGNYNTMQHWITHSDGLFLVYTRNNADNDHVFRHRAPLFIAQVDIDRMCIIKETETVLVPERGARLGNFTVTDVNEYETWVTVAEWMQGNDLENPFECTKYGSDNSVFIAKVKWRKPNDNDQKRTIRDMRLLM